MHILITGGAGYIGSHACVALMEAGHQITVLDDLSNSQQETIFRIEQITGKPLAFVKGDVRDRVLLHRVFSEAPIDAVIHFAGFKSVGESVSHPLRYFNNNVGGAISLFEVMTEFSVKTLVFSSSATVYGNPESIPINENAQRAAMNPYGASKIMVEDILADLAKSDQGWRIARLRYFNPVGAHKSGLIGEAPIGIPNNLMPYLARVAAGSLPELKVFGSNYSTHDGTGIRDYIHVMDLVEGHLAALEYLAKQKGVLTVNLGTGRGYSVFEMIRAFEAASGHKVSYSLAPRRLGDVAACYADTALAEKLLNWKAKRGIEEMCGDAWRWQQLASRTF